MRAPAALAALAALALLGPPARAAGLHFAWIVPQSAVQPLPAGRPYLLLARFGPGEPYQGFYLHLAAGQTETIAALVPAGAPPVQLTVRTPDGQEASLPITPTAAAPAVPVGMVLLRRTSSYPYTAADGSGVYAVFAEPAGTHGEPYALALDGAPPGGLGALGPAGAATLLQAPVTVLRLLLWLWG
jgi:hypothetical protein